MSSFSESTVEEAAVAWLEDLGYAVLLHGPAIVPDKPAVQRHDYGEAVLDTRLRDTPSCVASARRVALSLVVG